MGVTARCCIFEKRYFEEMLNKEEILSKIKAYKTDLQALGIVRAGLFGSYVRGEQSDTSDIDILIEFEPEKENFDNYMSVCDFFEKLYSGKKIEVVTRTGLSPYIGPRILKEVVYA